MRAGLAFWAGVLGAIVMSIGMWIAYGTGATGFVFGWWWGSMALGSTSGGAWVLGFFINLILGGLIGLVYAAFFEAIGRANWALGLLGGFIQLVIGGFVLGWISDVHPAIPQVIVNPGFFTSYWGWASILTFCLVTLAFGLIMGVTYKPIHQKRPARKKAEELPREEQPVGAGRVTRREEEAVHVPPAPEERGSAEERPPMKIGKGRRS
jgi:hypothetical protein